ncbi:MAG TPA: HAD-IC family P-type ATPase, partial [Pyrinomonadaceae bacterium]|nr:HAD-IC family P-type ATPase [Pyrinomonadaceae bacterium]
NQEMATRALRVLAFADQELEHQKAEEIEKDKNGIIEKNYTFLGFAGMSDPPREGVAEAIQEAQTAGIRVIMLTGDQVMTARAVANQLQLNKNKEIIALHSSDISDVRGENLANIVRQTDVFARVSPEDKLRIVEALQQTGEIVAVTGDGVNDAPALERSDIGIAMGERGTEVAKEAADVVLTDDNFSTIVKAIESGRTIYTNIIKFVHFLFTSNLAEVLVIFVAIMLGLPLPLLPLQILWINLVTDVFPAFALSVEPSTPETMQQPPRSPTEALISGHFLILIGWQGTILATIALGAYLWALSQYGEGAHSHTIALLAVVGVQLGQLFNCRSRSSSAFRRIFHNPFVFLAAASVILLQILAVNFPPLMRILDTVEPNMNDWLITLLSIILPILIVEIAKFLVGRNKSTN